MDLCRHGLTYEEYSYCSPRLRSWLEVFVTDHNPWISLVLCVFGCVSNLLCILVLTRRRMLTSTGTILTGLAISDLLVLASSLPLFAMQLNESDNYALYAASKSYSPAAYAVVAYIFFKVMHVVSAWLTLTLAVWQYMLVFWPIPSKQWCTPKRAKVTVVAVYVCIVLLHTHFYYGYEVDKQQDYYIPGMRNRFIDEETGGLDFTYVADLWVTGVLATLVPCIAVTFLAGRLVWTAVESRWIRRDGVAPDQTWLVVSVLLAFLATGLPDGVASLLLALWGPCFSFECAHLTKLLETIVLLNCAVHFVLYCATSFEFRQTLKELWSAKKDCLSCLRTAIGTRHQAVTSDAAIHMTDNAVYDREPPQVKEKNTHRTK